MRGAGAECCLAPEALYEYVRRINEVMDKEAIKNSHGVGPCDVVYTNHDSFVVTAACTLPSSSRFFADLLYSYNYLGPLVFLSRRVLEAIQSSVGFSSESFDYDLVLKATAQAERVERIDKVLYHVSECCLYFPRCR